MIRAATKEDYPAIVQTWELSVKATHDFLPEDYFQEIKAILPSFFPRVSIYVYTVADGAIKGFAGVAGQKIEMLFIHPDSRGQGIGRFLTEFCVDKLNANKVDVNEQNGQAVGFYERIGFVKVGRQELDGTGRPFPLLHMEFPV